MCEIASFLFASALQIFLTFLLVRRDERRILPEQLRRAFPEATFWIAVVVFGPLALPLHFVRTRRNWAGFGLGLIWLAVTFAVVEVAMTIFEIFLGII